jgi:hypothetical protein
MNALLALLAERRARGLAWFLARTFGEGLCRARVRGDPVGVRRAWAVEVLRWEAAWRDGLRRRDGGCRGR